MGYYGSSSRDGVSGWTIAGCIFLVICIIVIFKSCTSEQSVTKNWGGTMEVELDPNQKLVEVTWKDNSLWLLTKDMQEDDIAEKYNFYKKDSLGLLGGSVHISETKLEKEELEEYNLQKQLEEDYYKEGNFVQSEGQTEPEVVFIKYDEINDKYIKVKEYKYDKETGALISK